MYQKIAPNPNNNQNAPLLQIDHLSFSYDKSRVILDDLSLKASEKESIGIIGANGAGKTSLLKLLVGLLSAQEGSIRVGDTVLNKKTLAEIRRRIGYVFQDSDSQLFMPTVAEDIAFGPRNYGFTPEEVAARVVRAMELTDCTHLRDQAIHKLSGGEKKIVAIATILALDPEIVIMDEPTNNLDPKMRRRLIALLKNIDSTRLIVSHDLDMIWECCTRVILIGDGKILADGQTTSILTEETLLEANSLEVPLSAKLYRMQLQQSDC